MLALAVGSDVEDVCDRVVIYYGGQVQAMGTLDELLATPDAIRITAPLLQRATLERVLEIIRAEVSADKVCVDAPTQNLESFFLNVVQQARLAQAQTSGATSGNRVAEYLRGGEADESAANKTLERLMKSAESTPVAGTLPVPVDTVNHERLSHLAKPAASAPSPEAEKDSEPAARLEQANEKLSSLLPRQK